MCLHNIVADLYRDRRVNDLLSKLEPADLRGDLLHHCILYIYRTAQKWPGKIEALAERGELFAWFQRCVKMELIGTNSAFRRTFRTQFEGEEVLMTNDHISRISDSRQVATAQAEQDQQAEARHGKQFVDYFYDNYHRRQDRKDKMLRPALQTKQPSSKVVVTNPSQYGEGFAAYVEKMKQAQKAKGKLVVQLT